MKLTPSATGPQRRKPSPRTPATAGDSAGTIVRLSRIGVVQVIRLPADLRFDAESVRLIRDGNRLIVEPVGSSPKPTPLPFRTPDEPPAPRGRRRAPDADARVPAPVGPKLRR